MEIEKHPLFFPRAYMSRVFLSYPIFRHIFALPNDPLFRSSESSHQQLLGARSSLISVSRTTSFTLGLQGHLVSYDHVNITHLLETEGGSYQPLLPSKKPCLKMSAKMIRNVTFVNREFSAFVGDVRFNFVQYWTSFEHIHYSSISFLFITEKQQFSLIKKVDYFKSSRQYCLVPTQKSKQNF